VDHKAAADRVRGFIVDLAESESLSEQLGDSRSKSGDYRQVQARILGSLPLVRQIATRVSIEPERLNERSYVGEWGWHNARAAAQEILGALESAEEAHAMFAPTGPRLATSTLNAWVWSASADLWDGGYRRQAVQDAYTKVETMAKVKLEVHDSGKDLWAKAFSTDAPTTAQPRFRFDIDPSDKQRWTSAHEGAQRFGMGCAQGIRNWAAHDLSDTDEAIALEYLASISVLARWVESASVSRS
jgi:hypothetical protein